LNRDLQSAPNSFKTVVLGLGAGGAARSAWFVFLSIAVAASAVFVMLYRQLGPNSALYVGALLALLALSVVCVYLIVAALLKALRQRDLAILDLERTALLGDVGLFEHDLVTDKLRVNDVFRDMWELPVHRHPELSLSDLLSRVPQDNLMQVERWIRQAEGTAASEAEIVLPDGRKRWLQMNLVADHLEGYGTINRGAVFDISELHRSQIALREANELLQRSAVTDELTGLYNRRYIRENFGEADRRRSKDGSTATVILLDIDHFKRINDQMGHDFGDEVLFGVSEVLRANVRQSDTVARWGGEEFLVILPGTIQETGEMLAEKLRAKIEERVFRWGAEEIRVTASLGLADLDWTQSRLSRALIVADSNLYEAKRTGRNKVVSDQNS